MSRTDQNKTVSRRDALTIIGVAGGATMVATAATTAVSQGSTPDAHAASRPSTHGAPEKAALVAPLDETTRALFAPIQAHGRVGDCTLVAVHGVTLGGIPVILAAADGVRFQVDVLRHDASEGGMNGVRTGGSLTVALHNEGGGNNGTREAHGLGAMALLDLLAAREVEGAALPALLTLRARGQQFPRGVLDVLSLA